MIYWTPLELAQVFEGCENLSSNLVQVEYDGILLEAESLGDGKAKIQRLLSTEPMDFLRTDLQPGTVINVL